MSFTSALTNLIISAGVRKSWLQQLLDNTKFNNDRIDGDNGESTGAGGHDHTGSGEGSLLTMEPQDFTSTMTAEGESTTTSPTFVLKVSHSFTPPTAGDYIIQYQFEITHSVGVGETDVQADLDSGTQIAFTHEEPVDADDYMLHSGFSVNTLTAATHALDIDFLRATGSGLAKVRRVRVATWRIS